MDHLWRLWREEEGQDIAEYAVMLALIIAVLIAAITSIGGTTSGMYNNLSLKSSLRG